MPVAKLVTDVQARHHRGESVARLFHAEQFGNGAAQRLGAVIQAAKKGTLRHGVA